MFSFVPRYQGGVGAQFYSLFTVFQATKRQTHAMCARIAPVLPVFPQSTVFFQAGTTLFDNSTFRNDLEGAWLRTRSKLYLHMLTQNSSSTLGNQSTDIAAIIHSTVHLP